MDQQEQIVINLIVNAGSARSSAIEAIQYAKAGDIEKAEESACTWFSGLQIFCNQGGQGAYFE